MRMVGAIGSGLSGVTAGFERLDRAAARIASDGSGAQLAGNAVDLMRARTEVRTGLAVMRAADDLVGSLIDAFA